MLVVAAAEEAASEAARATVASLPDGVVQVDVLARLLSARDLAAAACASRRLNGLASDQLWGALAVARLGQRLVGLLEASPGPPEWWAGRSWRQRLAALAGGASFQAQVFNRELENEAEDFLLSSYDATVCLTPASATALRCGDASQPLLWTARYLPMGRMAAVEEAGVPPERLRLPPVGSSPWEVYGNGTAASAGLAVGEEVEVQWKGRRSHPFGWWFGTVQSARGNRVVLVFRQYPRTSVWHRVKAPIKAGQEALLNGDFSFGYVGGLRRLTAGEREEWRRHGAPSPPTPSHLAALEAAAAAEEDWSSDEEDDLEEDLELDADLAAELEAQLEADLLAPAAVAAAGAAAGAAGGPEAALAVVAAGAVPAAAAAAAVAAADAAAAAAAAEEAAPGPAAPPGEPIAMQLSQGAGGVGQPVALAAGAPVTPGPAPAGDAL